MSFFGPCDLAIDLGTATTRVADARHAISHGPSIARDTPALHCGVIRNPRAATAVLRPLMQQRRHGRFGQMRVLACAPTDVSKLERHMVRSCILEAGASSVIIVPEPLAAAVGAGLDIGSPYAKFLVDFGEGVTDCAIIRNGHILTSLAERTGVSDLHRALREFVRTATGHELTLTESAHLLRQCGLRIHGIAFCPGTAWGYPVQTPISLAALHETLRPVLEQMMSPIKSLLASLPPTLDAQVIEDGIFLTGGGALIPGLRDLVAQQSGIDTHLVPDPIRSVIQGARHMLPLAASLKLWDS